MTHGNAGYQVRASTSAVNERRNRISIGQERDFNDGQQLVTSNFSFNLTPVNRAVLVACGATVATTAFTRCTRRRTDLALEEIVVTARKRSENLQDVPISVQAFGDRSDRQAGHQDTRGLCHASYAEPDLFVLAPPAVRSSFSAALPSPPTHFSGTSSAAIFLNETPAHEPGSESRSGVCRYGTNRGRIRSAADDLRRQCAVRCPQVCNRKAGSRQRYGGFVDISGTFMEEGNSGYDVQGAINIPLIEDELALRHHR